MASVGSRIKQIRTDLGISQVDFANRIGVSKQTPLECFFYLVLFHPSCCSFHFFGQKSSHDPESFTFLLVFSQ